MKTARRFPRALTQVEAMIAAVAAVIAVFGTAIVLSDSQRGWNRMFGRVHSEVLVDSQVARKTFDAVTRRASGQMFLLDDNGQWLEVHYHSNPPADVADLYARFFINGGDLCLELGRIEPRQTLSIMSIAKDVSQCVFKGNGRAVQMLLTIDDGSQSVTTVTSAVMHN